MPTTCMMPSSAPDGRAAQSPGEPSSEAFALTDADLQAMAQAAKTTRIVALRVGHISRRIGWFELAPGQNPREALVAFLRAAADSMEQEG